MTTYEQWKSDLDNTHAEYTRQLHDGELDASTYQVLVVELADRALRQILRRAAKPLPTTGCVECTGPRRIRA